MKHKYISVMLLLISLAIGVLSAKAGIAESNNLIIQNTQITPEPIIVNSFNSTCIPFENQSTEIIFTSSFEENEPAPIVISQIVQDYIQQKFPELNPTNISTIGTNGKPTNRVYLSPDETTFAFTKLATLLGGYIAESNPNLTPPQAEALIVDFVQNTAQQIHDNVLIDADQYVDPGGSSITALDLYKTGSIIERHALTQANMNNAYCEIRNAVAEYTQQEFDLNGVVPDDTPHYERLDVVGSSGTIGSFCGDGFKDSGFETCDDGATFDSDGCSSSCELDIDPLSAAIAYVNLWLPDNDSRFYLNNREIRAMINGDGGTRSYARDMAEIIVNNSATSFDVTFWEQILYDYADGSTSNDEFCIIADPFVYVNNTIGTPAVALFDNFSDCNTNTSFNMSEEGFLSMHELIKGIDRNNVPMDGFLKNYLFANPELYGGSIGGNVDLNHNPTWVTWDPN